MFPLYNYHIWYSRQMSIKRCVLFIPHGKSEGKKLLMLRETHFFGWLTGTFLRFSHLIQTIIQCQLCRQELCLLPGFQWVSSCLTIFIFNYGLNAKSQRIMPLRTKDNGMLQSFQTVYCSLCSLRECIA